MTIAWQPLPRQRLAHACPASEVFFGGVKGGGKTDAIVMKPAETLALAQRKFEATGRLQRCMMTIFRKTLQNESRDIIKRTQDIYPLLDPGAKWSEPQKTWTFPSGATVTFSHLHAPEDYQRWDGVELVGIGVDQAEKSLKYEVFKFFTAQNRHSDPDYDAIKWMFLTGNPGGEYADWLYEYFIGELPAPDEKYQTWEVPVKGGSQVIVKSKAFITSRLSDNPYYYDSGEYEATLRSMTPEQQKWYIDGDWSQASDGCFSDLLNPTPFIETATCPRRWELTYAIQFDPIESVVLFAVRSPANRIYFIDELSVPGSTGTAVGRAILARFKEQEWDSDLKDGERRRKHDNGMGFINPEGADVSMSLLPLGLRTFAGSKHRVSGWRSLRERLSDRRVKVFRDRCPLLCKQLKRAQASPKDPSDIDDGSGENVTNKSLNAARMICQAWPWIPQDKSDDVNKIARWETSKDTAASADGMSAGYGD